jgi:molybdenum cofactor cytidylyltransferase
LINSSPDVDATVLLVCDQPAVDARVLQRLIALGETSGKTIVASTYADTLGVPALFSRSVFQELLSVDDKAGAKSIILRNHAHVASLSFPEGEMDIDTWEDWEKLGGASALEHDEKNAKLTGSDGKQASSREF